MNINKDELLLAAFKAGISEDQALNLWKQLSQQPLTTNKFDLPQLLYYFGALIVISAMGWFLGTGWEKLSGLGILAISLIYMAIFATVGAYLWHKTNFKVPGGLFVTLAVCMIPLAVYGFQHYTGLWLLEDPGHYNGFYNQIKGGWFLMELGTLLGSLIALKYFRFPFLTAPLYFALWYMSMDFTPLIFREGYLINSYLWVSLFFGLAILIVAYLIDCRTKKDFAFWGYLFGMLAFWGGLSLLDSGSEVKKFIYFIINLGLMLLSVFLQRNVFVIFGALGVFGYLGSLAFRYFYDSTLFPFVLSLIGVFIIFLGIVYNKNRKKIESALLDLVPESIVKWLPQSRKRM